LTDNQTRGKIFEHLKEVFDMDEAKVLKCLKELHEEIEIDAGQDTSVVKDDTEPLDGLGGFDSPLIPNVVRGLAKPWA